MSKMLGLSELTQRRITKWMEASSESSLEDNPTWTERRMALKFGGHTFLVTNGQIFQCGHCGHYDPEWNVTEVLRFFKDTFGIEPVEIEIECAYTPVAEKS